MRRPAAAVLVLSLALGLPPLARAAEPEPLRLDLPVTLGVGAAAGGLALLGLAFEDGLAAPRCRVCAPNRFDRWVRDGLRWGDTGAARTGSDVLAGAVPVLAATTLLVSAARAGGGRTALEDLAIAGEAVSLALLATQVAKFATGRQRPYAWADPGRAGGGDDNLSFWSGHTATTFAAVSAAGTVARLRGYRSWPWILGLGLAGATATGWLRIAADRHWATDVLVGAAVGSAAGFGLPLLLHGRRGASGSTAGGLSLTPLPFGIAGSF